MADYLTPPLVPRSRNWPSRIIDRPLGSGWLEPESPANHEESQPKYPFNKVQMSESGHMFEMDDTKDRERVRLQHRTGTFIEMHPNGDEVHKVYGDGYEITIADKNVLVEGHCSIEVRGDSILNVKKDYSINVEGDMNVRVKGKLTMASEGNAAFLGKKDVTIGSGGDAAGGLLDGEGSLILSTAGDYRISGDLTVDGAVICDMLNAKTSVDAGTGVTAGFLGFASVLGGLSIGLPLAIPGQIIAIGSVTAPLGAFGIMTAVLMKDVVNTALHNIHFHIGFKGPTSPPIPKMI